MKKSLVILMAIAMLFAMTSLALAVQDPDDYDGKGNIRPNSDVPKGHDGAAKDYSYKEQGEVVSSGGYNGSTPTGIYAGSTHVYGTWNSPYTAGVDGYNYNDAQDYTDDGTQVDRGDGTMIYQSGPHGGYLTSTHRCRECHAVHRAAGKFKLLRSDTRFEACDWCHGTGAGSGYNIQMDNNDGYTEEYNVGHTMGFGISSGKWKAPDDTFPAFTPNYWMGGFSCFDCHSPHANPARLFGYDDSGKPVVAVVGGVPMVDGDGKVYNIVNSGHDALADGGKNYETLTDPKKPIYLAGSWILIKNPDRELAVVTENVTYNHVDLGTTSVTVAEGTEISDMIYSDTDANGEVINGVLEQFKTGEPYPVNKLPIDWNSPIGVRMYTGVNTGQMGYDTRSGFKAFVLDEFCTDCHDGNAGFHTVKAPLFSEDRALRGQGAEGDNWKGNYDLAYGHDQVTRHCGQQMMFNPEDDILGGPRCRNCHRGSSACNTCHADGVYNTYLGTEGWAYTDSETVAAIDDTDPSKPLNQGKSLYTMSWTATGDDNPVAQEFAHGFYKKSRTVSYPSDWRESDTDFGEPGALVNGADCSDDGFSWPHRTLGWKMLKDDLFGLDFDGSTVGVGGTRTYSDGTTTTTLGPAHDIDSVCLDCHNPTIWNATSTGKDGHVDDQTNDADNHNDELLTRGLP